MRAQVYVCVSALVTESAHPARPGAQRAKSARLPSTLTYRARIHASAPAGFNTGSTYLYGSPSPLAAQRAAMNTTLAASSSGLVALLLGSWLGGTYDLRLCCNGVLSGLVTVTAMCGFVDPYAAVVCGIIAGACYIGFSHLMVSGGVGVCILYVCVCVL